MNKHIIIPIATAVAGLGIGYVAGIAVTRKQLIAEIDEKLNAEIASVRAAYNRDRKATEFATPESVANTQLPEEDMVLELDQEAIEAAFQARFGRTSQEGDGFALVDDVVTEGVENVNVFEQAPVLVAGYPNPDDENAPYLITVDQFHEEHEEYDKNSIVWYAGDLVLADETEQEIHDIPNTVSPDFAEHFGEGSLDENIVYYRNDRLAIDFEISIDHGLYAEKVMGIMPEAENEVEESFQKIARKRRVRDDRDD